MRERNTLVRKTDNESRRRERSEKRSRCVLGEFCFSLSREGLEEPFDSHEIGKENHV